MGNELKKGIGVVLIFLLALVSCDQTEEEPTRKVSASITISGDIESNFETSDVKAVMRMDESDNQSITVNIKHPEYNISLGVSSNQGILPSIYKIDPTALSNANAFGTLSITGSTAIFSSFDGSLTFNELDENIDGEINLTMVNSNNETIQVTGNYFSRLSK